MQYFLDDSGNFQNFRFFGPVVDPNSPYLLWKYFKKYKKNRESFQKNIIFSYLIFLEFRVGVKGAFRAFFIAVNGIQKTWTEPNRFRGVEPVIMAIFGNCMA